MDREEVIAQIGSVQDELRALGVIRFVPYLRLNDDDLKDYLEATREQLTTRKRWLGIEEICSSDLTE